MHSAILTLKRPTSDILIDMTGMIKILGDRPMIDGVRFPLLKRSVPFTVICVHSRAHSGVLARRDFEREIGGS